MSASRPTLYVAPGSCSLAPLIALEEAVADYHCVRLDFATGQQRGADYLKVNPKGRVPALVTAQGTLTENPAILGYIAQAWPAAKLAPGDPFGFAQMQAFNGYLSSTVHVAHAHGTRGTRWADEASSLADLKRKVPETMTACFQLIERDFLQGPWVMGAHYSVADGYLFTIAQWLEGDQVDLAKLPKVADHRRRMAERPAVQRAKAVEQGKR